MRLVQSGDHLAVHIPRAQRSVVRLSQLLQRAQQAPPYTAVLGLAEDGAVLMANLAAPEVAHVLIAGATGSGKTVLARTIVLSLCARHRPAQFGLVVIDPKLRGEDVFENAVRRHLLLPIARTPEAIHAAIARVVQAMERRTPRDAIHPRVLVYVDELADVCHMGAAAWSSSSRALRSAGARLACICLPARKSRLRARSGACSRQTCRCGLWGVSPALRMRALQRGVVAPTPSACSAAVISSPSAAQAPFDSRQLTLT